MAEQGGHAFEGGAVADAGRHGDDRGRREAADHAGQRALHAGDHDDGVGVGQLVDLGQQAVQTRPRRSRLSSVRREAERREDRRALVGHGQIGGAGRHDDDPSGPGGGGPPDDRGEAAVLGHRARAEASRDAGRRRGLDLVVVGPGEQDGRVRSGQQLGDDRGALLGRLARPVDGLGQALAQVAVVVDPGEAQVGEGQPPQLAHGVVGRATRPRRPRSSSARSAASSMTCSILPNCEPACDHRVAYFGPAGTFTEEALLTQPDLAAADLRPLPLDHRRARRSRPRARSTCGFVPIENSIEGTVSATLDGLVFDVDLLIQREVVMAIHLHLMAPPGHRARPTSARVSSYPARPGPVPAVPAPRRCPTPSSGRPTPRPRRPALLGESGSPDGAAIAPRLAAELYGLEVLAEDIEDHPDNQTRFVLVARTRVPAPTGHDKTSIVCFQRADHPGQPARDPRAVRRPQHQPDQARVAPDQAGARRLLLRDRPRGPRRRRGGRRLPARPARRAGRGEVPRLVPGGRRARARAAPPGRRGLAGRRRLARRIAVRHRVARDGVRRARVRRDLRRRRWYSAAGRAHGVADHRRRPASLRVEDDLVRVHRARAPGRCVVDHRRCKAGGPG